MLKYDTCEDGIYHAFALIVTEDAKSDYSVTPSLQYRWGPGPSNDAPLATGDEAAVTAQSSHKTSQAIKLYHYDGQGGDCTFWRFKLEVPLADQEQTVSYSIDGKPHPDSTATVPKEAKGLHFSVPSKTQNFRWVGHSCNGFSASLDPAEWNGPNPLWDDVLKEHATQPYHAVVGGGDQSKSEAIGADFVSPSHAFCAFAFLPF